jgi:hypothetical protein
MVAHDVSKKILEKTLLHYLQAEVGFNIVE